jgi:hypothetical protein
VDSVNSGYVLVAGSCEHGDEPSGSGATELVVCTLDEMGEGQFDLCSCN